MATNEFYAWVWKRRDNKTVELLLTRFETESEAEAARAASITAALEAHIEVSN